MPSQSEIPLKPLFIARYVDDNFVIWQHSRDQLNVFLDHLNSQHPAIRFTIEMEENGCLPFLDVLVMRESNHCKTTVFRKKSNSERFIPFQSYHAPQHKAAAIHALTQRALTHCSTAELQCKELGNIFRIFRANGFPSSFINSVMAQAQKSVKNKALVPLTTPVQPPEEQTIRISIPYLGHLYHILKRKARKYGIALVPKTIQSITSLISKVKTPLPEEQRAGVVYNIQCSCGKLYVGQTDREVKVRIEEHEAQWHLKKGAFTQHPTQPTSQILRGSAF